MSKQKKKKSGVLSPAAQPNKNRPEASGGKSAKDRREERQREKRRQNQMYIAIGAGIVGLLVLVALIVRNLPAEAPIPVGVVERYADIPSGITDRQFPRLGNSGNTIAVVEYSSFGCSACAKFHKEVFPSLLERVKAGEISYTFVPLTTGSVPNALGAARAALCVQEQNLFWPYHDTLFSWVERFANGAFSPKRLETAVGELGLDVNAYNACITSDRVDRIIETARAQFRDTNFEGTPAIVVQGVELQSVELDDINAAIDERLALLSFTPSATEEAQTESATAAATAVLTEAPSESPTTELTVESTEVPTIEPTSEATPSN